MKRILFPEERAKIKKNKKRTNLDWIACEITFVMMYHTKYFPYLIHISGSATESVDDVWPLRIKYKYVPIVMKIVIFFYSFDSLAGKKILYSKKITIPDFSAFSLFKT